VSRARSVLLVVSCALVGALAAVLMAEPGPAATLTTAPTTEPPPTEPPPPPATLPEGVTIAGLAVGGLMPEAAAAVVRTGFSAPLVITVAGSTLTPTPGSLGAVAYVQNAVTKARTAAPGTEVPLYVRVDGPRVRAYVATLAQRFDKAPQDARLVLRQSKPFIYAERPGRAVDRPAAVTAILAALRTTDRIPLALPVGQRRAAVTAKAFGPVVVVQRGSNRLHLYNGTRPVRTFTVATGARSYPTPLGRFTVIAKWANPWWHPPNSDWARGLKPVPPGPGNPLGTRWMGISSPGVGIHGTPDAASLGYSVSHGCIRMAIPEAEWLFRRIKVGTPVFIVGR
jgi:lipoprotein-anchoring transpeptidase ErfK/SrfK